MQRRMRGRIELSRPDGTRQLQQQRRDRLGSEALLRQITSSPTRLAGLAGMSVFDILSLS
jgi:hypothetical protein